MFVATGVAADEDHLWVKAGATEAIVALDLKACTREARQVPAQSSAATPVIVGGGIAAGAAGGAAGYLMEALVVRYGPLGWAGEVFLHRCMERQRYVWLPLEADEVAARSSLRTAPEKSVWLDQFYAGDLSARMAEAAKPVVPPLPEGAPEPLSFAGLRFDPAGLTVAKGVVPDDGAVLSGQVVVAHTARLRRDVALSGGLVQRADAGAIFYEVTGPAVYDRRQSYWCGPFHGHSIFGSTRLTTCVSTSDAGYDLWPASGDQAFAGAPLPDGYPAHESGLDFSMDPTKLPSIGPFKFVMKAQWLNAYNVQVEADVFEGGHRVTIFKTPIPFAPDGTAVIPFWTHRLVLRRVPGSGVTATFTADGDGKGWLDVKLPNS
jgi:hypothetical protein